jgi:hypothetical protein
MWPVTFYVRTPRIPLLSRAEAPLTRTGCSGELWRAKARENVCADCSRVNSMFVRSEETERGKVGMDTVGTQHVGTGMGQGGIKGRIARGNNLKEAVRRREAVVKVMANATLLGSHQRALANTGSSVFFPRTLPFTMRINHFSPLVLCIWT